MNNRDNDTADDNALYADPEVYDILHEPGTAAELRGLERAALLCLNGKNQRWIEPACGSGRLVRLVAGRGRFCAGFDLSRAMIRYAKRAAEAEGVADLAEFFVGDMRNLGRRKDLAAYDVAVNPINSIRHLATDAAMHDHLRAVRRALRPGGVYVVGLSLCAYGMEEETEDVWRGRRGRTSVTQVIQYLPPRAGSRVERAVSHLTVRTPGGERHLDSAYDLRGYNLAQWERLIGRSAMRLGAVADSMGRPVEPTEPGYFLFVLC